MSLEVDPSEYQSDRESKDKKGANKMNDNEEEKTANKTRGVVDIR